MMGKSDKIKRFMALFCAAALLTIFRPPLAVRAEDQTGHNKVIVSLGDSYSSGEGIEPFYGQDECVAKKVKNLDWLAHRSKKSWSGMLTLPGVKGTMADHRNVNWYFVAASGACTCHMKDKQKKPYKKNNPNHKWFSSKEKSIYKAAGEEAPKLDPQLDVFKKLKKNKVKADYVTLTLGGNDLGFLDIVTTAVLHNFYLNPCQLSNMMRNALNELVKKEGIGAKLHQAYKDIAKEAGPQAKILVAGYPHLFDMFGKGLPIEALEAKRINYGVSCFNRFVKVLVDSCRNSENINIWFVSVEEAFKGHEAYSWPPNPLKPENTGPFINKIIIGPKSQELDDFQFASSYSVHPNEKGARTYAACVQNKINELEAQKQAQEKAWKKAQEEAQKEALENIQKKAQVKEREKEQTGEELNPQTDVSPSAHTNTVSAKRDIVLVLDGSGSMEGKPIEETRKASQKFLDTILGENANVGLAVYDSSVYQSADISANKELLKAAVSNIYAGGRTNIESGLLKAKQMLDSGEAKKKIIVLMSDGEPNEGKRGDELVAYANELKKEGVLIYTIGFFEDTEGSKSDEQLLMERLASEGCHYEVADADDLVFFFGDIGDQISGQKYIYIRIACPVDVRVNYNGQTLDSSEENLKLRTDFGTLTFEDQPDPKRTDKVKVLRLKEGTDYDVQLYGTGRGIMNYTVGFMDDEGEYSDLRKFEDIRITKETVIDTVAAVADESILNIDEDGDGKYDLKLRAGENGYGEEVNNFILVYAVVGGAFLLLLLILILLIVKRRKNKIAKERR